MAKKGKDGSGKLPLILTFIIGFAAAGALGYFIGQNPAGDLNGAPRTAANQNQQTAQNAEGEQEQIEIEPGNPVVAKVGEEEITRADVFNYIRTLPDQTRQLPLTTLFPLAVEQVVNNRVISNKTQGVSLDNDPKVQERLDQIKENIVREVYIQNKVEEKLTEERLKAAYEAYKAGFPEIEEVRARHILVKDKAEAKDLIKQIEEGADFAELAKEFSQDSSAENGGDIGYFAQNEVVPNFSEAAFALEVNEVSDRPVETEFGYHVVQVLDKRQRPPASYEQAKPFLESQLRQLLLNETIQEWKNQANVQRFDINGKPLEATDSNS